MSIPLIITAGFGTGALNGEIGRIVTRGYLPSHEIPTTPSTPTGGFWFRHTQEYERRRDAHLKRLREAKAVEVKTQELKTDLDKELAAELSAKFSKQAEQQARLDELNELTGLAKKYGSELRHVANERVMSVAERAIEKRTYSAMESLERELEALREEEQFLLAATKIILNQC